MFNEIFAKKRFEKELKKHSNTVVVMDYELYKFICNWLTTAKQVETLDDPIKQFIKILKRVGISGKLLFSRIRDGSIFNIIVDDDIIFEIELDSGFITSSNSSISVFTKGNPKRKYIYFPLENDCIPEKIFDEIGGKKILKYYGVNFINYSLKISNWVYNISIHLVPKKKIPNQKNLQNTNLESEKYLGKISQYESVYSILYTIESIYIKERKFKIKEIIVSNFEIENDSGDFKKIIFRYEEKHIVQ